MLPKSRRLNLKKDFKWLVTGQKFDTKYAAVYIRFAKNQLPMFAVAAPSRNFKKAVDRNRVKRVFYQAFQDLQDLPKSINIFALPKPACLGVKSEDILLDLKQCLLNLL